MNKFAQQNAGVHEVATRIVGVKRIVLFYRQEVVIRVDTSAIRQTHGQGGSLAGPRPVAPEVLHAFAAAVNTTAWPVSFAENPLTIRDLLDVAVTRYESFPIFVRRYPRDVFDYAFDALFQKPVLVGEHHGFFRHGYGAFVNLIKDLSTLRVNLECLPLARTVETSCVLRQTGDGQRALRHYTPVLRLKNPTSANLSWSIEKPEEDGLVEAVLVGGHRVPFEVQSGFLKYTAQLHAGEELNVAISYNQSPLAGRSATWKYRLIASARRVLSDVRDNQLARSERVLSFAEKTKNVLVRRNTSR